MFNPRALFTLAAFGAASALFGGNALLPQELAPQETLEASSRGSLPSQDIVVSTGDLTGSNSKIDKSGKKPKIDNAAGRLDWWRERLGGDLTPEFMARLMREAELQRLLYPDQFHPEGDAPRMLPEGIALPLAVAGTTWTNLGPTKSNKIQNGITLNRVNSGRLRTILPDPANANILYVLTSGGGLWKTTDLLDTTPTWRCLTDRVGSDMGGAAAFGKIKSGTGATLYLGLGDAFDNGVGGFVVKSSDAGNTWSPAIQLTGTVGPTTYTATKILDLKVDDTGASDIVLVGTNVGLFRSTNSGATFTLVNNAVFNGKYVWSLVRTGANTWIASTEDFVNGTAGSILRSTDGGAIWSPITGPIVGAGRMTLASAAPGELIVYCFAADTGDGAQLDLFRSTNGGQTWTGTATDTSTAPSNPNAEQGDNDYMQQQPWYNHLLLVDPIDGARNTVYVGGQLSLAKNTNGGATGGSAATQWKVLTNWLAQFGLPYAHADFHCAATSDAGGTHRIFIGNDGGLFVSTNGGTTWDDTKNVGIISHLVFAMASGPLNNCDANSVLMGLQDNGTHNRIGATSVFDQTNGGDGFGVGWSQATNAASLSSYVYNNIYRCTSNPPDDQSKFGIPPFTPNFSGGLGTLSGASYYFVTPIITAPFGADPTGTVFYTYSNTGAGTNSKKIFMTSGGGNWTSLGTLPSPTGPGSQVGVRAVSHGVGLHPTDGNRIAAACNAGYVITTTNAGSLWTARDLIGTVPASGARTWQGFNSSVAWVDNNTLFACSESTGADSIHVVKSTDGGANWAASENGLPDLPVVKIVADPGDANTLYAATWLGVYRTTDQGANWSLFGAGLPQALVSDLYIHPTSSFLRASIYGRGIWQVGPTPTYSAPIISVQPTGGSFTPPAGFSLSATVPSTYPAATYQWRRNGVNLVNGGGISGATTPTLTLSSTTCASAGDYTLAATNCAGTTVSSIATMTSAGAAPPLITTHPPNTEYATGNAFTLSVVASGSGLTYRWTRNGTNLVNGTQTPSTWVVAGATGATLSITNARGATAGTFACVVTNSAGCSTTSNNATVISQSNQGNVAPNICTNPVDVTVNAPTSASFTVTAGGGRVDASGRTFTFQWRKNGVNLTNVAPYTGAVVTVASTTNNKMNSTLTINPTSESLSGSIYDCRVTTSSSASVPVICAGAKLTVNRRYTPATAVSITPSPALPVPTGTAVTFTAVGSGSVAIVGGAPAPAAAYQYQFWFYIDDNLGWTMVQDYGVGNSYTMPATTQPGTYGIGVDCRTSPSVLWDVFNAINIFTVTPIIGPGGSAPSILAPRSNDRPEFNGGRASITINQ
ncbi:MAG: immunoglobulin domain-containing protein [Holophagaceae bacterium]|nr:immunoglobulin domain-containing protein [Holophagaceae bacterium]